MAPLHPADGSSGFYPLRLLASSVAPVPSKTLRDLLPECGAGEALVLEPENHANGDERKKTIYKQYMARRKKAGYRTPAWFPEEEASILGD